MQQIDIAAAGNRRGFILMMREAATGLR